MAKVERKIMAILRPADTQPHATVQQPAKAKVNAKIKVII